MGYEIIQDIINLDRISFFKLFTTLISEDICGNKCMDGHRICTCGNTNYSIHEMRTQRLYCCNTSPCETIDKYIVCKTGVIKNVDEKCENECPLSEGE